MIERIIEKIAPVDARYAEVARGRWNDIAKPLHGLGIFEDAVCRLAAVQKTERPHIARRALAVFCADNGIVCEGVTQTDSSVTAIVAENLCTGATSVCKMARVAKCDVFPVDIGMNRAVLHEKMTDFHVARGTQDFLYEDAMTREQTELAVIRGAEFAETLAAQGYNLLAAGEMGIGNTTTSSAVASVLLGIPAEDVTGAGAGLSEAGIAHKIAVIKEGIARRKPNPEDPIDVLSKVGGLDIAGMAGFMLGAAANDVAVVLDGVISQVAALIGVRLCPAVRGYLLGSHVGSEKASRLLLDALELDAPVHAGMHVGEGTGAMTLLPLLDMAISVYDEMATFDDIRVTAYREL